MEDLSEIWLVRHAPVGATGLCYGQSDVPTLIDAEAAADRVTAHWRASRYPRCDAVWASPWARTRPVAEEIARRWNVPCQIDARLSELCFGEWEGRLYADLEREDGERFATWMSRYETGSPPGGESLRELVLRVAHFREEVKTRGGVHLAVTHAGVVRALRMLRDGGTYEGALGKTVEYLVPEKI
jgi:alpha-ribazole phosphatase